MVTIAMDNYKHTQKVKGIAIENKELAERIGDLYYDSLSEFLTMLAEKIYKDSEADKNRGREQLAHELQECANHLSEASKNIANAWDICAPFVAEWEKKHGKSNRG